MASCSEWNKQNVSSTLNDDKIEAQDLDIAVTKSFFGDPIKRLARTGARGEPMATPSI